MEIWKEIDGFPRYSVSSEGRIKNNETGHLLALVAERGNYLKVTLYYHGKAKRVAVHRAVATAFIPNPENKATVNHINGIHNDNRVENLEWATQLENNLHKYHVLGFRMSEKGRKSISEKRKKPVMRVEDGKIYP